jgi:hypothetical protein
VSLRDKDVGFGECGLQRPERLRRGRMHESGEGAG